MAELFFKVSADATPVAKLKDEILDLEKTLIRLKKSDLNFSHWLKEFDRLQSELEKKRIRIEELKKDILTVNPVANLQAVSLIEKELASLKKEQTSLINETVEAGAKFDRVYQELSTSLLEAQKATDEVTIRVIQQKNVVANLQSDVRALGAEYRNANKEDKSGILSQLTIKRKILEQERVALNDLKETQERAKLTVKGLSDEIRNYERVVGKTAGAQTEANLVFGRFESTLLKLGGAVGIKSLVNQMVKIRSEFQNTEASFKVFFGSAEKAKSFMKEIQSYAFNNVFEFKDLTEQASQLLAFQHRYEDIIPIIDKLSNVAAGANVPLEQLIDLYNKAKSQGKLMTQDIQQWQRAGVPVIQELAKQFDLTEQAMWKMVTTGKVGFKEIDEVINKLTSDGGMFAGMMEEKMKTLGDSVGLLQDTVTSVFNELGEKYEDYLRGGILAANELVENYDKIGRVLLSLVGIYGLYRTALVVNTVVEQGFNKAIWMNIKATQAYTSVQAALNKVLSMNPYVAVGMIAASLVTTMWSLHDSTTAAEKAQKDYNKKKEDAIQKEKEHTQHIDSLISKINEATTAELERVGALDELKAAYPGIIEKYITEEGHLKNIVALKKEIAELESKNRVQSDVDELNRINSLIKEAEISLEAEKRNRRKLQVLRIEGELKILYSKRDIARKAVQNNQINQWKLDLRKLTDEQIKVAIAERERLIATMSNNESDKVHISQGALHGKFSKSQINEQLNALRELSGNKTTYSQDLASAKKEFEESKKGLEEIEKEKDKFTTAQYEAAKERKEMAEKAYKDLGGIVDPKKINGTEDSQSQYRSLLEKQTLERIRIEEDMQNRIEQEYIDSWDEGSKKYIAQMELNHEKEMQAIDRQKEDFLREKIKYAREAFEADPDKKGTFDASSIQLSQQENMYFDNKYKFAIDRQGKTDKELLNKYQDYADQRLAIEEQFNKDIETLQKRRKKAETDGNTDLVGQFDSAIAQATTEKGKALISFDFERLKESPEYVRAFEDLRNTSTDTLNSLLSQLEEYKQTAAESLDPAELREYIATIQDIMDELMTRDPFKALAASQKELADATVRLSKAKGALDLAKETGDVEKITKATNEYNEAQDDVIDSKNKIKKAYDEIKGSLNRLYDAIDGVAATIGGTTGEILTLMTDMGRFVGFTVDNIEVLSKKAVGAIQMMEKASVILAMISTAINLLQRLDSILPTAHDKYEKYAKKLAEINKLRDAVNEYELAVLKAAHAEDNWFGNDRIKGLSQAAVEVEKIKENYYDKLNENQAKYQNKKGGGFLKKAVGVFSGGWFTDTVLGTNLTGNKYNKDSEKAVNNLTIETKKAKKGFAGIGSKSQKTEDLRTWAKREYGADLFDKDNMINVELAKQIIENQGDKLMGETRETLEYLIAQKEQLDEYLKQLRDYVADLYEPLIDNFVDSIWDWFDSGKDALDSFKDYASNTFRDIVTDMMRTIVISKVFDGFGDDIANMYEKYVKGEYASEEEFMKDVTERTSDLINDFENGLPALQNIMNVFDGALKEIGIDLKNPGKNEQQATKRGFETMTQDTASELNGRFTALQAAGEEIKIQNAEQSLSLLDIKGKLDASNFRLDGIYNIADETMSLLRETYLVNIDIRDNTSEIIKPIKEIRDRVRNIEKSAKDIAG